MFGLGAGELLVIGVFALVFIGPKKLPELAKSLGRGIREFQKAKNEITMGVSKVETEVKKQATEIADQVSSASADSKDDAEFIKPESGNSDHPEKNS